MSADGSLKAKTGSFGRFEEGGINLIIDGHVHIQSNSCCPLPLIWGALALKFPTLMGRDLDSRATATRFQTGWIGRLGVGRFGPIGRLGTLQICRILMQDESDHKLLPSGYVPQGEEREAELEITKKSKEVYTEFDMRTQYFFGKRNKFHMFVVMPMDLTFAHYWGRDGIPIYLFPMGTKEKGVSFINDFMNLYVHKSRNRDTNEVQHRVGVRTDAVHPDTTALDTRIHLFPQFLPGDSNPQFSIQQQVVEFERFHQTGAAQNPFYIHYRVNQDLEEIDQEAKRRFVHIVQQVPGEAFEDFRKQLRDTQVAALLYPLQILPFYHYDPRRHFHAPTTLDQIADAIVARHSFFRYEPGPTDSFKAESVEGIVDSPYHGKGPMGGISLSRTPYSKKAYFLKLLEVKMLTHQYLFEQFFRHPLGQNKGLFWGVKMYPRLGYRPYDLHNYPHLEHLYAVCEQNAIPITAHCSLGGMPIADHFNYERYDGGSAKVRYDLRDAEFYFDTFVHLPGQWKNVLDKHKELKLCLAHFGGFDLWKSSRAFSVLDKETDVIEHSFTKAASQGAVDSKLEYERGYFHWTRLIASMVNDYDNVYTDISFFITPDPITRGRGDYSYEEDQRAPFVSNMMYLLKEFPGLRDRIIMGSDWYMIEMEDEKGVGRYYRKMFDFLNQISAQLTKEKYDAWHQFAVINPLRYLGLIDEKKGHEGPFELKVDIIEKYAEVVRWYYKDGSLLRGMPGISTTDDILTAQLESVVSTLKECCHIPAPKWPRVTITA